MMKSPYLWLLWRPKYSCLRSVSMDAFIRGSHQKQLKHICFRCLRSPYDLLIAYGWLAWAMDFVYKFAGFSHCSLDGTDRKDESLWNCAACPFGKLIALAVICVEKTIILLKNSQALVRSDPVPEALAEPEPEPFAEPEAFAEPEPLPEPEPIAYPDAFAEPNALADPEANPEPNAFADPQLLSKVPSSRRSSRHFITLILD